MVRENNIVFYEDYGRIAGRNTTWVHTTLTSVVMISERVGLLKNIGKTKETM